MSDPKPHDWTAEALCALDAGAAEPVVAELVRAGPDSVPLLSQAAEQTSSKPLRKLFRRGLHQLRSQGVDVPVPRETGTASVLRPVSEERGAAFVGLPGPEGRRPMVVIELAPGGARVVQLVCSDAAGVIGVDAVRGKRGDARRYLRDLRSQEGAVEVDLDSARALLRAYQGDRPPVAGIDPTLLRSLVSGPEAPTPGERARAELATEADAEPGTPTPSLADAEQLLRERRSQGRLPPWPLTGDAIEALARELQELDESPLVLSEIQKRERRNERVSEHAAGVLDDELRERFAQRLEETAAIWLATDDRDGARAAVRVAERVREADSGLDVEYLRDALDASIESIVRRLREEGQAEGNLIVPGRPSSTPPSSKTP